MASNCTGHSRALNESIEIDGGLTVPLEMTLIVVAKVTFCISRSPRNMKFVWPFALGQSILSKKIRVSMFDTVNGVLVKPEPFCRFCCFEVGPKFP